MKYEISDKQIEEAFEGTNFGTRDHRKLLVHGVLKLTCGYYNGCTLSQILLHLGLTTEKGNTTKFGRRFMFWHLRDDRNTG